MLRDKWQGRRAQEPRVIRFGADASFSTGVEEEVLVHEGCSLREFNQGFDAVASTGTVGIGERAGADGGPFKVAPSPCGV